MFLLGKREASAGRESANNITTAECFQEFRPLTKDLNILEYSGFGELPGSGARLYYNN